MRRDRVDFLFGLAGTLSQTAAMVVIWWAVNARLGPEYLGLWALIAGTIGVAQFSEMGLGQAMIRFAQTKDAQASYHTALVTAAVAVLVLLGGAYFPVLSLLRGLTDAAMAPTLEAVFPIMTLAMGAMILSRTPSGTLTGLNAFWRGHAAGIAATLVYVTLALMWIDDMGLMGVAAAQALAYGGQLAVNHLQATLLLGGASGLIPYRASPGRLRGMLRLSVGLQGLTLLQYVCEAAPRIALSAAGDLALVGFYHMGERLAAMTRELSTRPFLFLGGRFSALVGQGGDPAPVMVSYTRLLPGVAVIYLAALATGALFVADVWTGGRQEMFFLAMGASAASGVLVILGVAPYAYGLGAGRAGPLVMAELARLTLLSLGLWGVVAMAAPLAAPSVIALAQGVGVLIYARLILGEVGLSLATYGSPRALGLLALLAVYGPAVVALDALWLDQLAPPPRGMALAAAGAGFALLAAMIWGRADLARFIAAR